MSVTSSAYSRSPPTGRPRAIRDRAHLALEALAQIHRGGLALKRWVRGDDDLLDLRPVGGRLVHALEELADLEPVGADAIDGADRPVEDVVATAELAGPLDRKHVEGLFDHAHPPVVPSRVTADGAQGRVADVEAAVAEHHLVAHRDERPGERSGLRVRRAEQVVREALRRLGADPGQPGEGLDQAGDGLDDGAGHARLRGARGSAGRRRSRPCADRPSPGSP